MPVCKKCGGTNLIENKRGILVCQDCGWSNTKPKRDKSGLMTEEFTIKDLPRWKPKLNFTDKELERMNQPEPITRDDVIEFYKKASQKEGEDIFEELAKVINSHFLGDNRKINP